MGIICIFYLQLTIILNAASTFELSKADVSIWLKSFLLENYYTSFTSTFRDSSAKSLLLPTNNIRIPGGPLVLSSYIQLSTFKKLLLLVISYTIKAPTAPL